MQVGNRASITRRFSPDDIRTFQTVAGRDSASLHQVPEPLIGALFSYLLGVELPGFGTNYLKQEMHFEAAAPIGEPLTATVEITRLRPEKHLADLETICVDGSGKTICRGRALVLVRDVGA